MCMCKQEFYAFDHEGNSGNNKKDSAMYTFVYKGPAFIREGYVGRALLRTLLMLKEPNESGDAMKQT